jgi:hypothetical protein
MKKICELEERPYKEITTILKRPRYNKLRKGGDQVIKAKNYKPQIIECKPRLSYR